MDKIDLDRQVLENDLYITVKCLVCKASYSFLKGSYKRGEHLAQKFKAVGFTCDPCARKQARQRRKEDERELGNSGTEHQGNDV